jgi:hypothetical protein
MTKSFLRDETTDMVKIRLVREVGPNFSTNKKQKLKNIEACARRASEKNEKNSSQQNLQVDMIENSAGWSENVIDPDAGLKCKYQEGNISEFNVIKKTGRSSNFISENCQNVSKGRKSAPIKTAAFGRGTSKHGTSRAVGKKNG